VSRGVEGGYRSKVTVGGGEENRKGREAARRETN